jgi:hypothetical protein
MLALETNPFHGIAKNFSFLEFGFKTVTFKFNIEESCLELWNCSAWTQKTCLLQLRSHFYIAQLWFNNRPWINLKFGLSSTSKSISWTTCKVIRVCKEASSIAAAFASQNIQDFTLISTTTNKNHLDHQLWTSQVPNNCLKTLRSTSPRRQTILLFGFLDILVNKYTRSKFVINVS